MSTSLGIDLISGSIDASLAELDSRSRDGHSLASDIVVGPFGVLSFAPPSQGIHSRAEEAEELVDEPHPDPTPALASLGPAVEMEIPGPLPSTMDSLSFMDDFLHWSDLLGAAPSQMDPFLQTVADIDLSFSSEPLYASVRRVGPPLAADEQRQPVQFSTPQFLSTEGTLTADVPTDAHFLFKTFQDKVIPQMMVMPLGDKCPWKILNLSAAVMTFSDMTFLGSRDISHARFANLYGVLACAAIHLYLNPGIDSDSIEHWHEIANQTFQLSKSHMQLSLKHETQLPKKSKYKDQMMAICVLAYFAVSMLLLMFLLR